MWNINRKVAPKCASKLYSVVYNKMKEHNLTSIYIAHDQKPGKQQRHYYDVILKLKQNFNLIQLDNPRDIDKLFIDEMMCIESNVFMYSDEENLGSLDCTRYTSIYAYLIMGYRQSYKNAININVAEFV